jgi:hypothetical protein
LTLSINSVPTLPEEAEALAREIAGTDPRPEIQELARRIAEVQIYLHRVRHERHRLVRGIDRPGLRNFGDDAEEVPSNHALFAEDGPNTPMPDDEFLHSKPEGPNKFVTVLADKARQSCSPLDRYERRALARRKFAIRAFDAGRRRLQVTAYSV